MFDFELTNERRVCFDDVILLFSDWSIPNLNDHVDCKAWYKMHYAHAICDLSHDKMPHVPHPVSSAPSPQSLNPSQTQLSGIQPTALFGHWNSAGLHRCSAVQCMMRDECECACVRVGGCCVCA